MKNSPLILPNSKQLLQPEYKTISPYLYYSTYVRLIHNGFRDESFAMNPLIRFQI